MTSATAATPTVPFYNMPVRVAPHRSLALEAVGVALRSERPILGPEVEQFEQELAAYVGSTHAVGTASGTAALLLSMRALGVGPGVTVVAPALSFHSAVSSALRLGASVQFVDVRDDDATLDCDRMLNTPLPERAVVVPAHIFSVMCDMRALHEVLDGVPVIEDAAVALGMSRDGVRAGTGGILGAYSFQPVKMLPAMGDAGAIVTQDGDLARRLRTLRNHGQSPGRRFHHEELGWNARLDELNAFYLRRRLRDHQGAIEARSRIAAAYSEAFSDLDDLLRLPPDVDYARAFYVYVVRTPHRAEFRRFMAERGVETRVYYPEPLHRQPAFASLGIARGAFPVAEAWSAEAVALPLYPEMPEQHVEAVIEAVNSFAISMGGAR